MTVRFAAAVPRASARKPPRAPDARFQVVGSTWKADQIGVL
jgi:hypothetical protein